MTARSRRGFSCWPPPARPPARRASRTLHLWRTLLLGGLLLFQLGACSSEPDAGADPPPSRISPTSECEQQEAVGYPELEEMVRATLAGVDFTLQRGGACEETGSPRTVVSVAVRTWPDRRVAGEFLAAHGWIGDADDGSMESPDGAYWVNHITTRDADDPDPYVTLQFYEHADDPRDD